MNTQAMHHELRAISDLKKVLKDNQGLLSAIENKEIDKMGVFTITDKGNYDVMLQGDYSVLAPLIKAEIKKLELDIKDRKEYLKVLLGE